MPDRLRIGVDIACWANGRGYGRFARELLRALVPLAPDDEFVCFADDRAAGQFDLTAPNVRVVRVAQSVSPTEAAAADGARSPIDMLRFTRAVWEEPLDVFFSPSVYTYFPLPPRLRAVVTVHDAIAERFPQLTLPSARARLFWRLKVGLALKQARIVLTVSDFAARDLTQILEVPPSRIRVAVEAPAPAYRPTERREDIAAAAERAGVPPGRSWFVYVGGFGPHKRVDAIVRAHAALALHAPDRAPYLLLAGAITGDVFLGDHGRIRAEIQRAGTGDLVRWTGFVPDDELRHLLSGSIALLLPSECEGFGLPAVEAAACGVPVIATTMSPLPELLEGGGIFVDPSDEPALGTAMQRLFEEEATQRTMGTRALDRARRLTWGASAQATLGALREAAA
jgi:glycosyltransferase involved in cell wall biosynthesis